MIGQRAAASFLLSISLYTTIFSAPLPAYAQGNPDIYFDLSRTLSGVTRLGCGVSVDPHPPFNNFVMRELIDYDWINPLSTERYRYTITTSFGGTNVVEVPTRHDAYAGNEAMAISRTGRNLAYISVAPPSTVARLMFSSDYGATFTQITRPGSATYTSGALSRSGGVSYNNFVFGANGNLYTFYIGAKIGQSASNPWDLFQLQMLEIDPNGVMTHRVVANLSGWGLTVVPALPRYVDVVATEDKIVALVSPGSAYTPVQGGTTYYDVPMLAVYDISSQSFSTINFGAQPTSPNFALFRDAPQVGKTRLASDGDNIFLLSRELPFNNATNWTIREFPLNSASYGGFFINTAPAGQQPFMDFEAPALQFGTQLKDVGVGNGMITQIAAKWTRQGGRDHSVDVFGLGEAQMAAGLQDVTRLRIVDPNTGLKGASPTHVQDFSHLTLTNVFGSHSILSIQDFGIPMSTAIPLEGGIATSFCEGINMMSSPGTPFFGFHVTDVS